MTRIKETEIKQGLDASQNKANLQKLISYYFTTGQIFYYVS